MAKTTIEENNNLELYDSTKEQFKKLTENCLNRYMQDKNRIDVLKTTNNSCLYILDELMKDYITWQVYIATFTKNNIVGSGVGLSSHFHKISAVKDEEPKYPIKCFTTFLRSKFFEELILNRGNISCRIPTSFLEYVSKIHLRDYKDEVVKENEFNIALKKINFDFVKKQLKNNQVESFENVNLSEIF